MTRRLCAAAVVVTALGFASARAGAQAAEPAGPSVALTVGAGGAFPSSQPGINRDAGTAIVAGLDVAPAWRSGIAGLLGFRVEGGFATQRLSSPGPVLSGDVQTVHVAALVTIALQNRGPFSSYLLGGPLWARPSTRVVLTSSSSTTPGAAFEQTTHESVGGGLVGIGAGWQVRSTTLRVEARWMSLATAQQSTRMIPVIFALSVPLRR